jgi:hypothetical protein
MIEHDGHSSRSRFRSIAAGILLMANSGFATELFAATLEPESLESNEGYYQLRWEAEEPIRLVEASSPDFADARALYSGTDTGRVVSGKPDGTWYYRLESVDGARILSSPATITVRHHSLARAFSFFALGAVVFGATLGLILLARPDRDERR